MAFECKQARTDGLITNGNDYPIVRQASSQKTRVEVEKEVSTADGGMSSSLYQGA